MDFIPESLAEIRSILDTGINNLLFCDPSVTYGQKDY